MVLGYREGISNNNLCAYNKKQDGETLIPLVYLFDGQN
jgi:hypothetical protein